MASPAQFQANRRNAAASTGPVTPDGKARSSRNHLKFGLFATQNCVRPEETGEYNKLSKALWKDLSPVGPVEEMLAVEIVRTAWRLHRCAVAEAEDGASPATQAAVDRARASAHASLHRLLNDLRALQSDRWLRAEVLRDDFDGSQLGIADTQRVIKGLAGNERLKSQFVMSPIGIDPINRPTPPAQPAPTIRTEPAPVPDFQSPVPSPQSLKPDPRTLNPARPPVPSAQSPVPNPAVPRNSPCPCNSGLKYKRCCGVAAPPVLTDSPRTRASEPGPLDLNRCNPPHAGISDSIRRTAGS
jgi:hypothetical protein